MFQIKPQTSWCFKRSVWFVSMVRKNDRQSISVPLCRRCLLRSFQIAKHHMTPQTRFHLRQHVRRFCTTAFWDRTHTAFFGGESKSIWLVSEGREVMIVLSILIIYDYILCIICNTAANSTHKITNIPWQNNIVWKNNWGVHVNRGVNGSPKVLCYSKIKKNTIFVANTDHARVWNVFSWYLPRFVTPGHLTWNIPCWTIF